MEYKVHKYALFICCLLLIFPGNKGIAQTKHVHINGYIRDSLNNPVEFATLALFNKDSTQIIKSEMSDIHGRFILRDILPGSYILTIFHMSYEKQTLFPNVEQSLELDTIFLKPAFNTLKEVVITANIIKRDLGKYNVSLKNNPLIEGKNINNVLDILPGVSTLNGISLYGTPGTQVYIDGRHIIDLKELELLQADNIDNIEVKYKTGVTYDASKKGGIINIKLKKQPEGGLSGSFSENIRLSPEYGYISNDISSTIKYRYKKFNLYNLLYYTNTSLTNQSETASKYLNTGTEIYMSNYDKNKENRFSEVMSMVYEINTFHRIGGNFSVGINNPHTVSNTVSNRLRQEEEQLSFSDISRRGNNDQYQAALNYLYKTDQKGSNLKVILDYLHFDRKNKSDYIFTGAGTVEQNLSKDHSIYKRNSFEADAKWEWHLNDNTIWASGINYYNRSDNRKIVYKNLYGNEWIEDKTLSDHFKISGEGYGAYMDFSSNIKDRFGYSLGLRIQNDKIGHESYKTQESVAANYPGIYPSVQLNYILNKKETISLDLSYTRGIDYIPYSEIFPGIVYHNEYSYTKGNPDLKPAIYNDFQLTAYIGKINLYYNFYYLRNDIQYVTFLDKTNNLVKYSMPINIGKGVWHVAGINTKFNILKWWNLYVDIFVKNKRLKYIEESDGPEIKKSSTTFYSVLINNFSFKEWGGYLNFNAETRSLFDDKIAHPVYFLSMGAYTYLMKRKLTLKADITSLLYKAREFEINKSDYWYYSYPKTRHTIFGISIIYNFQSGKKVKVNTSESIQKVTERSEFK